MAGDGRAAVPGCGSRAVTIARILAAATGVAFAAAAAQAQVPARVVAVGGAVTEIVYALGAGERLVAVDSTSVYPAAALKLPKVGYMRTLSSEGVLAMNPQAVIATAEAGPKAAIAQIQSTGVPVTTVPSDHSFDTVRVRVRKVASALGLEARGDALEQRIVAQWSEAERAVAGHATRPRVLFLLAHTGNSAMVAGEDTAADAMIRYAGARNAFAGVQGYKPLTAEAAIAAAPDVVLITTEGLETIGGADRLWSRPGLALTPAGKAKRVVALDALYLLGFGPRLPQAVKDLAGRLHGAT
jgi:iron complex transport system substrate-binding protein